jgi:hypothetical protein
MLTPMAHRVVKEYIIGNPPFEGFIASAATTSECVEGQVRQAGHCYLLLSANVPSQLHTLKVLLCGIVYELDSITFLIYRNKASANGNNDFDFWNAFLIQFLIAGFNGQSMA